jgi:peroxiredoxin
MFHFFRKEATVPRIDLNVKAPGFTLPDMNGQSVSLDDFVEKKNVLVVFNRGSF